MTEADKKIVKSPKDKKTYKRIQLHHGLTCLLIHDPEIQLAQGEENDCDTEEGSNDESSVDEEEEEGEESDEEDGDAQACVKKAAAAMAVGVGSFSDPLEMQGLSHYLEHMLFMGSEKFPDENEYEAYLTKHGGFSNAFTELDYTVYHFDVKSEFLHGALDRFAQFFVAPLCKENSLEREVESVDSEFSSVLQDDDCRGYQLLFHTCKRGHLYDRFQWGNKKSLWTEPREKGLDIRSELMKHYKNEYGAERMSLVVLGGESLETLETWVKEMFEAVPRGIGPMVDRADAGYPFEGQKMYIVPSVKDQHRIGVSFQLPNIGKLYKKKAEDYVSHLVGHEGPGSLLSALKAKGWAVECSAGIEDSCFSMNSCVNIFEVSLTLTDAGFAAAPGLGLAPVKMLFQYLEMLRQAKPQAWVYEELKSIGEMKFRFQEEGDAADYVTRLSTAPFYFDSEHTLNSSYIYEDWDPELVEDTLSRMDANAIGLRIDLQTKQFEESKELAKKVFDGSELGHEPWFDYNYMVAPLNEEIRKSWMEPTIPDCLTLPPRNPYIPQDFALKHLQQENGEVVEKGKVETQAVDDEGAQPGPTILIPSLLCDESGLRVWHKLDGIYEAPKTNIFIKLSSLVAYATARDASLLQMMLGLCAETLNEESYLADVAGLHSGFHRHPVTSVELRISGYNDKLPLLTMSLVKALASFKVDPQMFSTVHEVAVRKCENMNMRVDKHTNYLRIYTLSADTWDHLEVLDELRSLTPSDVEEFAARFLESIHVEVFVHGNTTAEETLELSRDVRSSLGSGILEASERRVNRCKMLSEGTRYLHKVGTKNNEEENSGIEVYFQFGPSTDREKALADLVDQMLMEPCYNILRTLEQLGYIVDSCGRLTYGVLGLSFSVISEKYTPVHLEERIDAFLQHFEEMLRDMSGEEFDEHRDALISENLEKDRNLGQASVRMWEHIASEQYDFDTRARQVAELQSLTMQDVQEWYALHLSPNSVSRRRLVIDVVCKQHWEQMETNSTPPPSEANIVEISNLREFRENLPVHPSPGRNVASISGIRSGLARAAMHPRGSFGRVMRFR
ncbi:hypothetical protein BSKO_01712 [Bryopsis sp. KO-2023]|nr:hypothetical protein BSKO_01712 [Bryopsis sp. KO-2023]